MWVSNGRDACRRYENEDETPAMGMGSGNCLFFTPSSAEVWIHTDASAREQDDTRPIYAAFFFNGYSYFGGNLSEMVP